jgi:hypothetical protein
MLKGDRAVFAAARAGEQSRGDRLTGIPDDAILAYDAESTMQGHSQHFREKAMGICDLQRSAKSAESSNPRARIIP